MPSPGEEAESGDVPTIGDGRDGCLEQDANRTSDHCLLPSQSSAQRSTPPSQVPFPGVSTGQLAKQKIAKKLALLLGPGWHEVISAFHGVIEVLKPIVTTFRHSHHALLDGLVLAQVRLVADEQD